MAIARLSDSKADAAILNYADRFGWLWQPQLTAGIEGALGESRQVWLMHAHALAGVLEASRRARLLRQVGDHLHRQWILDHGVRVRPKYAINDDPESDWFGAGLPWFGGLTDEAKAAADTMAFRHLSDDPSPSITLIPIHDLAWSHSTNLVLADTVARACAYWLSSILTGDITVQATPENGIHYAPRSGLATLYFLALLEITGVSPASRTCEQCDAEYHPRRPKRARFCGGTCRLAWHRRQKQQKVSPATKTIGGGPG